jgi:hypothetical protein
MVQSYRWVIRLARRENNRYELARACSNLGYYYIETKHLCRAELLSHYALSIFNDLQSSHGRAHTHNHLGVLFTRQCRWADAKEHLISACTIWQSIQDQFGLMRGHGNLGYLSNEIGNYSGAIHHSTIALELADKSGEEALIGRFAANISFGNLKTGNLQQAKKFASLAERIFNKYSDRLGLAQISHTNGLIAIAENDYLKAQTSINYALEELTLLGNYYFLIYTKFTKIELAIRLQDYFAAEKELVETNALIAEYLVGNTWQVYHDKLNESWRCLEQATRQRQ